MLVLDKTGTITHNGLKLSAVRPVTDGCFAKNVLARQFNTALRGHMLLMALKGTRRSGSISHMGSVDISNPVPGAIYFADL